MFNIFFFFSFSLSLKMQVSFAELVPLRKKYIYLNFYNTIVYNY